ACLDLGCPGSGLLRRGRLLGAGALQLLRSGRDLALALVEELAARRDARSRLRELALPLGQRLLPVAQVALPGLQTFLALGEPAVARPGPRRRLARLALERRLGARDLLLARRDRVRLLGEILGRLRSLVVGRRQLTELRLDVLLALGGPGLMGRELVAFVDEAAALELERLDLLGDVPLALLER